MAGLTQLAAALAACKGAAAAAAEPGRLRGSTLTSGATAAAARLGTGGCTATCAAGEANATRDGACGAALGPTVGGGVVGAGVATGKTGFGGGTEGDGAAGRGLDESRLSCSRRLTVSCRGGDADLAAAATGIVLRRFGDVSAAASGTVDADTVRLLD